MFGHPVTLLGYVVAVGGWYLLLAGVGSGSEVYDREIINLHSMAIAENIISLGYVLVFSGIIAKAFGQAAPELTQQPLGFAAPGRAKSKDRNYDIPVSVEKEVTIDPQVAMERKLIEKGLR
jgi:hypothetical protein